jgi:hypothetical protein
MQHRAHSYQGKGYWIKVSTTHHDLIVYIEQKIMAQYAKVRIVMGC